MRLLRLLLNKLSSLGLLVGSGCVALLGYESLLGRRQAQSFALLGLAHTVGSVASETAQLPAGGQVLLLFARSGPPLDQLPLGHLEQRENLVV